jgi:demethylmenaquinone methyltransferase/2-methoxy-6-polyprenyl-1,4-benzoquinol methylase
LSGQQQQRVVDGGVMIDPLKHSFGMQTVEPDERRRRIHALFEAIAGRYDLMNDLMSLGTHRWWKEVLARAAREAPGDDALDLAGGTGDIARLLVRDGRRNVMVCDPSAAMMERGRARLGPELAARVRWIVGEGEALPLPDASLDLVTISFGLRNMTDPAAALAECHRSLRPGGRLICLEFSRPAWWLRPFYDIYSQAVIPRLGAWVARHPGAYVYLVESIRRFPAQEDVSRLIEAAGFTAVKHRNLMFGIACLHFATCP